MTKATEAAAADTAATATIKGAVFTRLAKPSPEATIIGPAIKFKGTAPKVGAVLTFEMKNGVTYQGTASAVMTDDGFVFVEFSDGVTPTQK